MANNDIATLIGNPKFDVEKYIYYVNAHESNNGLMPTLMSDPNILLYIADSPNWQVLNRSCDNWGYKNGRGARFFDAKTVFTALHEKGHELWLKKTKAGNVWYGLVASEGLTILFRDVDNTAEMHVDKSEKAAELSRKKWKNLHMHKLGEDAPNMTKPGSRPIDLVRKKFWSLIKTFGFNSRSWRNRQGLDQGITPYFHLHMGTLRSTKLEVEIRGKGPHKVNAIYNFQPAGRLSNSKTIETIEIIENKTMKKFKDPSVVAQEILQFLVSQDKSLKSLVDQHD